jgi:hypothetical protein
MKHSKNINVEECAILKNNIDIVRLFSELSQSVEIWLSDEGWMAYDILLTEAKNEELIEEKVG